jgi:hypothetical protein
MTPSESIAILLAISFRAARLLCLMERSTIRTGVKALQAAQQLCTDAWDSCPSAVMNHSMAGRTVQLMRCLEFGYDSFVFSHAAS